MRRNRATQTAALLVLTATVLGAAERGPAPTLEDELKYLRAESYSITATRTREALEKTGATVTLITAAELRRMGARDLMDALRFVPGLGLTRNFVGQYEIEARGIKTLFSEKILLMIDGHSVNNQLTNGGAQWGFGSFPLDGIDRIEVILGPGSALYGANAFLGVVNMITRKATDIDGVEINARGGSFEQQQYNLLLGKVVAETHLGLNLNYLDSDGHRGFVARDNPLSPTPSGHTLDFQQRHNADLTVSHGDFSLRAKYARNRSGPFIGAANATNDESVQKYLDWFVNARYALKRGEKLAFEPTLYYDRSSFDNNWELFSENAFGLFPDGFRLNAKATTSRLGGEIVVHYDPLDRNRVVAGLVVEHQRQFDIDSAQNYDSNTFAPLPGGYQRTTDDPDRVFAPEVERDLLGAFAEDIWDVSKQVRIILGARVDRYSDFGATFNPRGSLIWELRPGYHLKLLYGSAFRDPTFGELHNKNNPVVLGNPDLEPETIKTFETGLSADITDRLTAGVTGFVNDLEDLIVAANPNVNSGSARVRGVEARGRYYFRAGSSVAASYSFQDAENKSSGRRIADTPEHRGNLVLNLALPRDLSLWTGLGWKGETVREVGDGRKPVGSYALVDATLNWSRVLGAERLGLRLSVFNLLDQEYSDPSPIGTTISDYPRAGRSALVDLSVYF